MDGKLYSKPTIERFMNDNLFFKDAKLRKRVHEKFTNKSFEKMVYVFVTDSTRDIILDTIGELTEFLKNMGDLIVSGGEAFNMYMLYDERIVTSDIDAKFVPRIRYDAKYFGKLQAVKLILWDKLGQLAQKLSSRIKTRILSMDRKLIKYLGIGFKQKGPYITRRYSLIKKNKTRNNNNPGKGDVFIDVELFTLDLKVRYYSIETGKIEDKNIGG